jgi:hypothetical protein
MCRLYLDHIDHLEAMAHLMPDAQFEAITALSRASRDLLTAIPGIGPPSTAAVISEPGTDAWEHIHVSTRFLARLQRRQSSPRSQLFDTLSEKNHGAVIIRLTLHDPAVLVWALRRPGESLWP